MAAAGAAGACASFLAYLHDPRRPTAPVLGNGWWSFSDQGRYLRATLAWAAGRLDPADHWYLPGYPLLAVPFTHLTHANPFALPDAAMLAITIWLAAALAGRLAPGWRWARVAGAFAALASILPPLSMEIWVTPWTSTPQTALSLGCLLAMLHFIARPGAWRMGFLAGLCIGGIAACRPSDALLQGMLAGLGGLCGVLQGRPGWRAALRAAAAAAAGVLLVVIPTAIAYLAVHGWQMSPYLTLSDAIGFEWRLLPLRWVTIMLDPRPLFPGGPGMIRAFPWLAPGLAGVVACLIVPPGRGSRLAHALVGGAACAHIALYLCYRDLHAQGLFRFYNYHYFKFALVVLALYTVLLLRLLLERQGAAILAGLAALALLLPWRATLVPQDDPAMAAQSGAVLRLPPMALGVRDAILVRATGDFEAIYNGEHNLYVGAQEEKWYSSTADFKVTPRPGGLMMTPLRPLRPGPLTLRLGPGLTLAGDPPVLARQRLVYGAPCWLPLHLAACRDNALSPVRRPGVPIILDSANDGILGTGWSAAEPAGRWTDGPEATLDIHVVPATVHVLQVTLRAFAPPGATPLQLALSVNDRPIGQWSFADETEQVLRAALPPGLVGPDGALNIRFAVANPRRPRDFLPGNPDTRRLGLSVRSIVIEP